jgi:DNA-binding FadR family transcriptional regulator
LAEHERILEAIADQEPEAARAAMRDHLLGSQKRYRRLKR